VEKGITESETTPEKREEGRMRIAATETGVPDETKELAKRWRMKPLTVLWEKNLWRRWVTRSLKTRKASAVERRRCAEKPCA